VSGITLTINKKTKGEMSMKKLLSVVMVAMFLAISGFGMVSTASAGEAKITGIVAKIEMAADGKSAVATIKPESGDPVAVTVTDDLTLDKFKDKRIEEGVEIRTKYTTEGGKNISTMFKKTAGC
jgi:uncharacterized membrane protein YtjA (UPF0391 family)